jgi:hypothetical protein
MAGLTILSACVACANEQTAAPAAVLRPESTASASNCLATLDGRFVAQLRGEIEADLDWRNAQMSCEGGARPGGGGIRVSIAGPLAASGPMSNRRLRFVFGIAIKDEAEGVARAFPTNVTLIVEGEQTIYTTLGDDKCAVEQLERLPLVGSNPPKERVLVRGYCLAPASDIAGSKRILIPTFDFTSVIDAGELR